MKIKNMVFFHIQAKYGEIEPCSGSTSHSDLSEMLRYDLAFQSLDDPALICFPTFHCGRLGSLGGSVTGARWDSFGVRASMLPRDEQLRLRFTMDKDRFVTYRHLRQESGSVDYTKLVPITLTTFERETYTTIRDGANPNPRKGARLPKG